MKDTTRRLANLTMKGVMACILAIAGANAQAQETSAPVTAIDILLKPDATMIRHATAVNDRLRKDYPGAFPWTPPTVPTSRWPSVTSAPRISPKSLPPSARFWPAPM